MSPMAPMPPLTRVTTSFLLADMDRWLDDDTIVSYLYTKGFQASQNEQVRINFRPFKWDHENKYRVSRHKFFDQHPAHAPISRMAVTAANSAGLLPSPTGETKRFSCRTKHRGRKTRVFLLPPDKSKCPAGYTDEQLVQHVSDPRNAHHRFSTIADWVMATSPYMFDGMPAGFEQYSIANLINLSDNSPAIKQLSAMAVQSVLAPISQEEYMLNAAIASQPVTVTRMKAALSGGVAPSAARQVLEGLQLGVFQIAAAPFAARMNVTQLMPPQQAPLQLQARPAFSAHTYQGSQSAAGSAQNYDVDEPATQQASPATQHASPATSVLGTSGPPGTPAAPVDLTDEVAEVVDTMVTKTADREAAVAAKQARAEQYIQSKSPVMPPILPAAPASDVPPAKKRRVTKKADSTQAVDGVLRTADIKNPGVYDLARLEKAKKCKYDRSPSCFAKLANGPPDQQQRVLSYAHLDVYPPTNGMDWICHNCRKTKVYIPPSK